jgi:hypothetical protein
MKERENMKERKRGKYERKEKGKTLKYMEMNKEKT